MRLATRWVLIFYLMIVGTACVGLAPRPSVTELLPSATPVIFPSPSAAPSPSATPTSGTTTSAAPSPSAAPSLTPTLRPTLTPSAIPLVSEAIVIYRPENDQRNVADVRWSTSGQQLVYALSPLKSDYLLDWKAYDFASRQTQAAISPYPFLSATWEKLGLGYPVNKDSYAELQGFVSPNNKFVLFPNAGFPNVFSVPNYIYLIPAQGGDRRPILGPTFRGKVGKAAWVEHETKLIFDYRYNAGVEVFVTDLTRDVTNLLLDLSGSPDGLNTEWSVAPNESLIFVPGRGQSQIVTLNGSALTSFESPNGLENPTWALNSTSVYYWDGNEARLMHYVLGDPSTHEVLALYDLMSTSPVKVVRGMPFKVSPDEKQIAFWWKNWIWVVKIK